MQMKGSLLRAIVFVLLAAAQPWNQNKLNQFAEGFVSNVGAANSESWQFVSGSMADGDTFRVQQSGPEMTIRLCGIDAPEKAQPLGLRAQSYLQSLINAGDGSVVVVPVERDRYGRMVAEVFVLGNEEKFLQTELLQAGLAYVYPQYVDSCPNSEPMKLAEAIAQEEGLGVWSGEYQRPWEFRQANR
jgi:endonuclease YncB( thermonuclease family)